MKDWYYEKRDEIVNAIIRFLLKHCAIHAPTVYACMGKLSWQSCQAYANEMKRISTN